MAVFMAAALAAVYCTALFIGDARARFIFLFAADAAVIGLMILAGSLRDGAVFFAASAFIINILMCLPSPSAGAYKPGWAGLLLSALGACAIGAAAAFAGYYSPGTSAIKHAPFPAVAGAVLFTAAFISGYLILRGAGRQVR